VQTESDIAQGPRSAQAEIRGAASSFGIKVNEGVITLKSRRGNLRVTRQTKREALKMRVLLFAAGIFAGLNGSSWAQAYADFGSDKTESTGFRLALMECNPSVSEECRRLMAASKPKQTVRTAKPKKPRS
jgi:hypothetical protein